MKTTFLGQGFENSSVDAVGNYLIQYLNRKDFHSFTGISAFASEAGIFGLSGHIQTAKAIFKNISLIVGIDQKGTSQEALEALMNLKINAFVFYQLAYTIFHPKIYLFEGADKSELIIGSSNLTSQGLFTNVEASLLISIDNSVEADRKVVEQLKDYFKGMFDFTDPNLKKLSKKIIAELVKAKVVPTEAERKAAQDKAEKAERAETEIIISKIFPKRALAKIPTEFKGSPKPKATEESDTVEPIVVKSKPSKLVWQSGPLKERDLNIPKGSNTNNTGSMLIKKGLLKDIDPRHYFRDIVFASLNWVKDTKPKTAHYERAKAKFRIIVNGKDNGIFELILSHDNNTEKKSYKQNQPMTKLSWGNAKKIIAKEELLGKSANLYKGNKKGEFTLEIN